MAGKDDEPPLTASDLDWIVENRYNNHKSSLSIYNLIDKHKNLFSNSSGLGYRSTANILLGVAFSLWRSVFLVKLKRRRGSLLYDTEKFLEELIDSNTISYAVDRNRKDWSFRYYMSNATYRLDTLSSKLKKQGYPFEVPGSEKGKTPQQQWIDAQVSLDAAVVSFRRLLEAAAARKAFGRVKKIKAKPTGKQSSN